VNEKLLTTTEIMAYLKISRPTALILLRMGQIKGFKIGKGWRVLESEIQRFTEKASSGSNDLRGPHLQQSIGEVDSNGTIKEEAEQVVEGDAGGTGTDQDG